MPDQPRRMPRFFIACPPVSGRRPQHALSPELRLHRLNNQTDCSILEQLITGLWRFQARDKKGGPRRPLDNNKTYRAPPSQEEMAIGSGPRRLNTVKPLLEHCSAAGVSIHAVAERRSALPSARGNGYRVRPEETKYCRASFDTLQSGGCRRSAENSASYREHCFLRSPDRPRPPEF